MSEIDITHLDLNLLVALDALLRDESVTLAARRLGKSQPALSHTLRKLRQVFDDQLLVPANGGMKPTPKAASLRAPLERVLHQIEALVAVQTNFEPASTTRRFVMGCPDLLGVVLEEVVSWFGQEAPHARFDMAAMDLSDLEMSLETGRHDIVLGTVPEQAPSSLRQRYIGDVGWCCLVRPGHPVLKGGFGLDDWVSYGHVIVSYGRGEASVVGAALQAAGKSRHVAVMVPGFLLAPAAVMNTDFIYAGPHVLGVYAQQEYGLVPLRPPIELPSSRVSMMWHERLDDDLGHRWFRDGLWTQVKQKWDERPIFD